MTLYDLAMDVYRGRYGNGSARRTALANMGYDFDTVQNVVTQIKNGTYNGGADYEYGGGSSSSPANSLESQIAAQRTKLTNLGDKPTYSSQYQNTINDLTKQYTGMGNYVSQYQDTIDKLSDSITNDTYYDPETDSTYQQYKTDYTRLGNKAAEDTLGKMMARTGGLGNSWAQYAAQQTYSNYMDELASKIPELKALARSNLESDISRYRTLESDARNEYDSKRNKLAQDIAAYKSLEDAAYQKYQNQLNDYYKNWSLENDALNVLLNQKAEQDAAAAAAAKAAQSSSGGTSKKTTTTTTPTSYSSGGVDSVSGNTSYDSVRKAVAYSLSGPYGNQRNAENLLTQEVNKGTISLAEANQIAREILGR